MNKATPIFSLLIYPTTLRELLDEIILSENFRPARKPILKGEEPIRELGTIEKALFTILLDVMDTRSFLLSSLPISSEESILAEKHRKKIELLDELLMNTIGLHPVTENIDLDRIGIREGHVIVLLAERRLEFMPMLKEDCMNCLFWPVCNYPGKVPL